MEDQQVQEQEKAIEEAIQLLPSDIQDQVREFIESLLHKRTYASEIKPTLDWRGALRDLREQYTAVELQHKALEWWGG